MNVCNLNNFLKHYNNIGINIKNEKLIFVCE